MQKGSENSGKGKDSSNRSSHWLKRDSMDIQKCEYFERGY